MIALRNGPKTKEREENVVMGMLQINRPNPEKRNMYNVRQEMGPPRPMGLKKSIRVVIGLGSW